MIRMTRISKKYYLRQIVACWLVCYMFLGIPAQIAMATPSGGVFTVGTGDITQDVIGGDNTVLVHQAESVIEWGSPGSGGIDTSSSESLSFSQLGGLSNSAVLNRIKSGDMTQFDGKLNGVDMRIFIVNSAGIVFGSTAIVNVSQLVASSLEIEDGDFINGLPYTFTGGGLEETGDVTNEGSITAEVVALIAKNVFNRGHIVADECAILAAGNTVLISENSPVSVEVTMGADWAPDEYCVYQVRNEDGDGIEVGQGGEMETAQVVLAAGDIWSAALVKASAGGYEAVATADIDIDAAGDVLVENKVVAEASGMGENEAIATVTVNSGGDVDVISDGHEAKLEDYEASIQAIARSGMTNTAEVLICADGYVTVDAEGWFDSKNDWPYVGIASIEAIAESIDRMSQNNTADVKIGAKEGIEVTAIGDSYTDASASIAAKATGGVEGTAGVVACTEGGVDVIAELGGNAKIVAEALNAYTTNAYVGICAVDDVIVAAGIDPENPDSIFQQGTGGTAMIKAEAARYSLAAVTGNGNSEPTSANAEVSVVSHNGGVAVIDVTGSGVGEASIEAEAHGAYENTADVGVAAYGDLFDVGHPLYDCIDEYTEGMGIGVGVVALGDNSKAKILSKTYSSYTNTSNTVVGTPGVVVVAAEGNNSFAKIKSWAKNGDENSATTQVYAGDVYVDVPSFSRGNGIQAKAGSDVVHPEYTHYCLTDDEALALTNGSAVLIIDTYANRMDCPDCPPCPCEEEGFFAPVAPLAQFEIPRIEGCPALTQAAALELGITGETLQVAIGNALALNPNIQPCQACATLVNAASILRDVDGSRMAAMVQVFNALAPANAPFTPEMATSIATAFGTAEEGSLYASVAEYIDAFVQYAAVLDTDLGSPTGDSVAFVMEKYGEDITGSDNGNIAAFVATRLEGVGG